MHDSAHRKVACSLTGMALFISVIATLGGVAPAQAQVTGRSMSNKRSFDNAPEGPSGKKPKGLKHVGLDESPGAKVPLHIMFKNAQGQTVQFGKYFQPGKPVLLTLNYHNCPMLCPMELGNLTKTMAKMAWVPGSKFEVITLDFNQREGPKLARQKKKQYLKQLGRPEAAAGWHFLTGTKKNIRKVTDAVGFHFKWLPDKEQYAHPATLITLNSDGVITRYLSEEALQIPPGDVRKALVETSQGKIGNALDEALLYCFKYDPETNSYVASAWEFTKIIATIIMILMIGLLSVMWYLERRGNAQRADAKAG